jgi:hypothetical protein
MAKKCVRLTPERAQQIPAGIRSGAYPHVAAEAYGVPREVFESWLARGGRKLARDPFRSFAWEVRQAVAQARFRAEVAALTENPKVWLINGPGREYAEHPGWSASVKPAEGRSQARNVLEDADMMEFLCLLIKILEPFAEARAHVLAELGRIGTATTDKEVNP